MPEQVERTEPQYDPVDQEWFVVVTIDGHKTWFTHSTSPRVCETAAREYITDTLIHATRLTPVAA